MLLHLPLVARYLLLHTRDNLLQLDESNLQFVRVHLPRSADSGIVDPSEGVGFSRLADPLKPGLDCLAVGCVPRSVTTPYPHPSASSLSNTSSHASSVATTPSSLTPKRHSCFEMQPSPAACTYGVYGAIGGIASPRPGMLVRCPDGYPHEPHTGKRGLARHSIPPGTGGGGGHVTQVPGRLPQGNAGGLHKWHSARGTANEGTKASGSVVQGGGRGVAARRWARWRVHLRRPDVSSAPRLLMP